MVEDCIWGKEKEEFDLIRLKTVDKYPNLLLNLVPMAARP